MTPSGIHASPTACGAHRARGHAFATAAATAAAPAAMAVIAMVVIAMVVTVAPASAQVRLSGGINLTRFFGDDVGATNRKQGLDLGASFPLFNMGRFQVRAEGYYRQKGARGVRQFQQAVTAGQPIEVGIDYVEVPVLLRLGLPGLGSRLLPYLEAGPAFAWRINCGVSFDGATGANSTSCSDLNGDNIEETLRDYEQGVVVGAGFDFPVMGIGALNLDARYTRGLSRLYESGEIRNSAFSVMLGYSFGMPQSLGPGAMGAFVRQSDRRPESPR